MDPVRPISPASTPATEHPDQFQPPPLRRVVGMVAVAAENNIRPVATRGALNNRARPPAQNLYQAMAHLGNPAPVNTGRPQTREIEVPALLGQPPRPPVNPVRTQIREIEVPALLGQAPLQPIAQVPARANAIIPVNTSATEEVANGQSPMMLAVRQNLQDTLIQRVNRLVSDMLKTPLAVHIEVASSLAQFSNGYVRPGENQIKHLLGIIRWAANVPLAARESLKSQVRTICDLHDQLKPVVIKTFNPYVARGG